MIDVYTVTRDYFRQRFADMDRADSFSLAGLDALYDWLEDYEDSNAEPIELDVIALCCDFEEHTVDEAAEEFSQVLADEMDADWWHFASDSDKQRWICEALEESGAAVTTIPVKNDRLIIQQG